MTRRGDTTVVVRNAMDGDGASLEQVVVRFSPVLMAQARQRLRRHLREHYAPEDLVQDVWLIALPKLCNLRARSGRLTPVLLSFLSGVLVNRYGTLLQKYVCGKPLVRQTEGEPLAATTTAVVERAVRNEEIEVIRRCIAELGERDQQVIVLRAIEQTTNEDAAAVLGLTPQHVAVVYHRSLHKLRSLLPNSVFAELADAEDEGR